MKPLLTLLICVVSAALYAQAPQEVQNELQRRAALQKQPAAPADVKPISGESQAAKQPEQAAVAGEPNEAEEAATNLSKALSIYDSITQGAQAADEDLSKRATESALLLKKLRERRAAGSKSAATDTSPDKPEATTPSSPGNDTKSPPLEAPPGSAATLQPQPKGHPSAAAASVKVAAMKPPLAMVRAAELRRLAGELHGLAMKLETTAGAAVNGDVPMIPSNAAALRSIAESIRSFNNQGN